MKKLYGLWYRAFLKDFKGDADPKHVLHYVLIMNLRAYVQHHCNVKTGLSLAYDRAMNYLLTVKS